MGTLDDGNTVLEVRLLLISLWKRNLWDKLSSGDSVFTLSVENALASIWGNLSRDDSSSFVSILFQYPIFIRHCLHGQMPKVTFKKLAAFFCCMLFLWQFCKYAWKEWHLAKNLKKKLNAQLFLPYGFFKNPTSRRMKLFHRESFYMKQVSKYFNSLTQKDSWSRDMG